VSSDRPSLIEGLRRADPLAFETLYARKKGGALWLLLRLARDPHVASDLFQNVWLKLARHAARLRSDNLHASRATGILGCAGEGARVGLARAGQPFAANSRPLQPAGALTREDSSVKMGG
jgi:hypothetical protein